MYRDNQAAIDSSGTSDLSCHENGASNRSTNPGGEQRLLRTILGDAIRCYLANPRSSSRARRLAYEKARSWLFDSGGDGPFTFEAVCARLSIDPAILRKDLNSMGFGRKAPQNGSGLHHPVS